MIRRLVAVVFAALLAVLPVSVPAHAAVDSTLTVGIADHGATLNPFLANLDPDLDTIASIYPSLVRYDEKSDFVPYLADKWTVSPDRLTWTFSIHPGLRWSDGKKITAEDVAWTLNLIRTNPDAGTANGLLMTNIVSAAAPDADTVVVTTKKPQGNLLYSMYVPIVPKHVWASRVPRLSQTKNTSLPVVGYGPWQLTEYRTDQFISLKANKGYFLDPPKYDKLILQTFKNVDAAVNGLRSGQVDQVRRLTSTEWQALRSSDDVFAYQQVGERWTGIEINPGARSKSGKKIGTGNPILADERVRRAIAYGIDRATLVKKVLGGLGQVGSSYLPPAFPKWEWKPSAAATIGYSPAMANALLDSAGYPRGSDGVRRDKRTGKALRFRFGTHSDDTVDTAIAGYVVSWMKRIGIQLQVQSQSNSALNANLAKGDWDLLMDGWGTSPDPTYLLGIQTCGVLPDDKASGGQTDAFFCDKRYDQLQAAQQQEFDPAKRAGYIREMQQILYRANVDIILFNQNTLAAVRSDVRDGLIHGEPDADGFYAFQNYKLGWQQAVPGAADVTSNGRTVLIGIAVVIVLAAAFATGASRRRRATAYDRE